MKPCTEVFLFGILEWLSTLGSMLLSTVFSPGWWLAKALLASYLPIERLTREGVTPETFWALYQSLRSLGATVLLGQILPLLLGCLLVSAVYLMVAGYLGQKIYQWLRSRIRVIKSQPSA